MLCSAVKRSQRAVFISINFSIVLWEYMKYDGLLLKPSAFFIFSDERQFITQSPVVYKFIKNLYSNNELRGLFLKNKLLSGWFKCLVVAGLGYKVARNKKRAGGSSRGVRCWIGTRFWWECPLERYVQFVFRKKYRSIIIFSTSKAQLLTIFNFFYTMKKPFVYKAKGVVPGAFRRKKTVFLRKLKMRRIKIKLTKKQKFI